MPRKLIIILLCLGLLQAAAAQGIDIRLDTRYSLNSIGGDAYGFCGDYLNLRIDGNLNDNLKYAFNQRLNKPISTSDLFDATDWVYLLYRKGNWGVQAGKMQLEYGGYEYDEAPIDIFWSSEYWYNFDGCFQFGLSGLYFFGDSGNRIIFQLGQSAFSQSTSDRLLSYNLCAKGEAGFYGWKHSANLFDLPGGGQIGNIVLGNSFDAGLARLELDLVQRGNMKTFRMFDDCTVIARLVVSPTDWMNILAKASYDCNFSQFDPLVPVLGEYWSYGGGLELFPRPGNKELRIHALYYYFHQPTLSLGLTWKIHLLKR